MEFDFKNNGKSLEVVELGASTLAFANVHSLSVLMQRDLCTPTGLGVSVAWGGFNMLTHVDSRRKRCFQIPGAPGLKLEGQPVKITSY